MFAQSERIAFENDLPDKFWWFLHGPLGNALSFLVVNDDEGRTATWLCRAASLAGLTYADVFGSLSTASDWTPKEMLMDVLRERYPEAGDVRGDVFFCDRRHTAGAEDARSDGELEPFRGVAHTGQGTRVSSLAGVGDAGAGPFAAFRVESPERSG